MIIKVIGRGLEFISKYLSKENLDLLNSRLAKLESPFLEEDKVCDVLEMEILNKEVLKVIFRDYGSKNFESVAVLKGEYDKKRDKRVFFIQKLNKENKQIDEYQIMCVFATNVEADILAWFTEKNMVLIKK